MPTAEHEDYHRAILLGSSIKSKFGDHIVSHEGYVITAHGYVLVWSAIWSDGTKRTQLEFIHSGRLHVRYFGDIFQPRYLVTLARRYFPQFQPWGLKLGYRIAADIAAKEPRNEWHHRVQSA